MLKKEKKYYPKAGRKVIEIYKPNKIFMLFVFLKFMCSFIFYHHIKEIG